MRGVGDDCGGPDAGGNSVFHLQPDQKRGSFQGIAFGHIFFPRLHGSDFYAGNRD